MAIAVVSVMLTGCPTGNSNSVHWSGTVTIDGQPLPADATGSITFRPTEKTESRAVSVKIVGGKYDAPEMPMGKVRAFFSISKPSGRMRIEDRSGEELPELESIVPRDRAPGIEVEVTGNNADGNFDL